MLARLTAKSVLESLRAEGALEYGIQGIDAIAAWFHKVGFCHKPPSRRTLFRWKSDHGCPFGSPRRGHGSWTSNLLLMAWAANRIKLSTRKRPKDKRKRYPPREPIDVIGREMVAEAIRKKLLASAPSRVGQGTPPVEPPSS